MEPLRTSDLIFPTASRSIHSTLADLKRSNLSITNRLRSIQHDANFVSKVADTFQFPLIANERCGSWYIPPHRKAESVYFKSTDGHTGQWSLNLRRLNLHLLEVIGHAGGCIIVDSTRRGKSMPDALSKTVPIWIATLNRFLFPGQEANHALKTPENVVSRSEHSQIEERIPAFVDTLEGLELDRDSLRKKLHAKPLEPFWVTQEVDFDVDTAKRSDRNLIVLCTASGRTLNANSAMDHYVQGAADDSESWACGLNPMTFWTHQEVLLNSSEEELPDVIASLMAETNQHPDMALPTAIASSGISIGTNTSIDLFGVDFDLVISCAEQSNEKLASKLRNRYLHFACASGKVGSRQLRRQLPKLESLGLSSLEKRRILVTCPSGRDLAIGVALAVTCLFIRDNGSAISKSTIKQQLSLIMLSIPSAAPSGATLQSVNSFLLSKQAKDGS